MRFSVATTTAHAKTLAFSAHSEFSVATTRSHCATSGATLRFGWLEPSGRSSTPLRRRMTARELSSGESASPKWRSPDRLLLRSRPWQRGQLRSSAPSAVRRRVCGAWQGQQSRRRSSRGRQHMLVLCRAALCQFRSSQPWISSTSNTQENGGPKILYSSVTSICVLRGIPRDKRPVRDLRGSLHDHPNLAIGCDARMSPSIPSMPRLRLHRRAQVRPYRSGHLAHLRRARVPLAHVILVALQIGGAIVILVVKFQLHLLRPDVDLEHRRLSERGEGAERIPDIAAGLLADLDGLFRRVRYLAQEVCAVLVRHRLFRERVEGAVGAELLRHHGI